MSKNLNVRLVGADNKYLRKIDQRAEHVSVQNCEGEP